MSDEPNESQARAIRPSWVPPGWGVAAVGAGIWWDAVVIPKSTAQRILELLREVGNRPPGPVICDPCGPTPRMYFLVPPGTARHWSEPGSEALGECCYVGVPGDTALSSPGVHWAVPPRGRNELTDPDALRAALAEVSGARGEAP